MSEIEKSIYRLVLHPEDANYTPESTDFIQTALREVGFIGDAIVAGRHKIEEPQSYLVGDQFLQLLTFMGCSPNINLAPKNEDDHDFCHIVLNPVTAQPRFRSHERDVFARCPECGRRDTGWRAQIEYWQTDTTKNKYTCPHCHKVMSVYDLRWRQQAGMACFFIDVFSIFPQEGIPTDNLLALLSNISEQSWIYFFTNR